LGCIQINWKDVGNKIRDARIKLGMSQTELAKAIGVSNQFLCQVEAGKKGVSAENLAKLSKLLKVNFF